MGGVCAFIVAIVLHIEDASDFDVIHSCYRALEDEERETE